MGFEKQYYQISQTEKDLIVFDDDCLLCKTAVRRIVRYDRKRRYYFTSLSSNWKEYLSIDDWSKYSNLDTMFLYSNGRIYHSSTAVVLVVMSLFPFWSFLFRPLLKIPPSVRDNIYRFIAKNRKIFFKSQKQCPLQLFSSAFKNRPED